MFLDFIPDLGKGPNQKTHQYAYLRISCVFWFRHFQRPKLKSKSIFLIKCYTIAVNFFWENFVPKNDVPKKWFYIILSKSDLGGGKYFVTKKILKKPNIPDYAQVLVDMCLKPISVAILLFPPPTSGHYDHLKVVIPI